MNTSILIFLGIAFALVYFLRMARIGTLLAFLIAGFIAGPHGLKLWEITEIWSFLGEIGITFLWFGMGLELNVRRLWQMRTTIFGFGAGQVLMVAAMLFPILFGIAPWTILGTVMVCLLLSMSSSSADLGILADRNELQTSLGRQTFSILLFQDLLALPLLAMIPIFSGRSFSLGAEIIDILVMSAGLLLGVVVVGRWLLNPLMKRVSRMKSKEAFLMAVLLNLALWAVVAELVGLPPAIGAFLAGMLLSETVYRHQVQADIDPYRTLFLAFFFIALGMGMNLPLLALNWWVVIAGAIGLVIIKFFAIFIVARVRKVPSREASLIALILAQGGEFGLLVLQTMKSTGIEAIPLPHSEILMAVIILSMMTTPILLAIYDRLYESGKLVSNTRAKKINIKKADKNSEVIICGFGRVGQTIARMLESQNIPYAAIDMNVDQVVRGRSEGFNVFYGDTTKKAVLADIGLVPRRVRAVVIALDNAHIAKSTVRAVRALTPGVRIFARARNLNEASILKKEGAKLALPETIESSFMLGEQVLSNLGVNRDKIDILMSRMRGNNYETLSGILNRNK
ncbi:MAG: cation:proton antiporter [Alphaproteobacteria bacterium]|nr:cation:proton antiporter [Alphaproteobacteria bacterium]